jgi:hypothetical protein
MRGGSTPPAGLTVGLKQGGRPGASRPGTRVGASSFDLGNRNSMSRARPREPRFRCCPISTRASTHAQHGIVCEHPQVAGEGKLESSTDRMPVDRCDGHDVRPAQPQESRLAAREPVPKPGLSGSARRPSSGTPSGEKRRRLIPVRRTAPAPRTTTARTCGGKRSADRREPTPIAGVTVLRRSGRQRVIVATAHSTSSLLCRACRHGRAAGRAGPPAVRPVPYGTDATSLWGLMRPVPKEPVRRVPGRRWSGGRPAVCCRGLRQIPACPNPRPTP